MIVEKNKFIISNGYLIDILFAKFNKKLSNKIFIYDWWEIFISFIILFQDE